MIEIELEQDIYTNFYGIKQLFGVYNQLKEVKNQDVFLCFKNLSWIDANLSAVLQAIMHKLKLENNLVFYFDKENTLKKFDILFKNGFANHLVDLPDTFGSAIPLAIINNKDEEKFLNYITNDILDHYTFNEIDDEMKKRMKHDLLEIFMNVGLHAETDYPVFVCGQYYHRKGFACITIVDLGVGFLKKIKKVTEAKSDQINTYYDAIEWAIKGNSTKPLTHGEPGGSGLKGINRYCKSNNSDLQIISGDCYWGLKLKDTMWNGKITIDEPFAGTVVNFLFKKK